MKPMNKPETNPTNPVHRLWLDTHFLNPRSLSRSRSDLTMVARIATFIGVVSFLAWPGSARAEERKTTLTLTSPVSAQVFQRGKGDLAAILIEGTVSDNADVIEAMADLAPGAKRGTPVKWVAVTAPGQKVTGKFTGRLTLPAGGWYQVTVRARTGTRMIAEQLVDKVGVGEVFVTAGQSNSANFGNPQQKAKDERVV